MPTPPRPKPTQGAGPYSGYSKNFRPIGKSLGTPVENFVVDKVLGAGPKPTSAMAGGKSFPVRFEEAGVSGVVGSALRAGAKAAGGAAARGAGRAAEKGLTQKIGSTISKETQDALKSAVKTPTKTGTPPKAKPVKPLRENYKTDSGHARALNSWEQKVRAWNRANPDDPVKITVPKTKPAGGKIDRAVEADVKKAGASKTAQERQTIAAGKRKAKTLEAGDKIDPGYSVKNLGTKADSNVVPRFAKETGDLPKGVTKDEIKKFASRDVEASGKARPPARAKQAEADLEESLKRARRLREEGRIPGEDLPASARAGSEGKFRPKPPTEKQRIREKAAEGLTEPKKPTNPGKEKLERSPGAKASFEKKTAQYEKDKAAVDARKAKMEQTTKDINEGRRKATGELKGASKKSADRQERKVAKAEGRPVDKGTKFTPAKPKAESKAAAPKQAAPAADKPRLAIEGPKPKAPRAKSDLADKPTQKGPFAQGPGSRGIQEMARDSFKSNSKKVKFAKIGAGGAVAGAGGTIVNRKTQEAVAEANAAKAKADKAKADAAARAGDVKPPKSKQFSKPAGKKDKAGDKGGKFGPTGESPFLKGRTRVRESTIQLLRKQGMTKSLARAKSMSGNKEYIEALRRFYGEKRLKAALKGK